MLDRAFSLGVALLLALLIWLYASSREQEMLDNVPVPVQVALPPAQASQWSLEVVGSAQVPVSFRGPMARVRELRELIQRGELRAALSFAVPEDRQTEARCPETLRVEPSDLALPAGVTAILVEGRDRVAVVARRLVERTLPVRVECGGDERIVRSACEPPRVTVRGPQDVLDRLTSLSTKPVALPSKAEGLAPETITLADVPLEDHVERQPLQLIERRAVDVRLTLQPRRKTYEVEAPIHFLCPANFGRRPKFRAERDGRLTVKVVGPAAEESPKVFLFIDLTAAGKFAGASPYYDEPLQVQLPMGYTLDKPLPRFVAFELAPTEAAPGPGVNN